MGRRPLAAALLVLLGCGGRSERPAEALQVVIPRAAEELDPRFVTDPWGLKVSRLLFASLVAIDPHSLEVVPDLAESVEQTGPTTYVARLRPDLRFADGSALRAEDVRETFRGLVDPALGSVYARTYERIASIETPDPQTVVFELDAPHATFLTDLEVPIVRRADAHRRLHTEFVGAGPYRLQRRTDARVELRANPHWYAGAPTHPAVDLTVVRDDNTRAMRLMAGAADLAYDALPPLLVPLFEDDPAFEVRSAPGISTTYLGLNMEAGPLSDGRVRRAIALAIDRETLVRAELEGRGSVASSWIPTGHWADAHLEPIPYDPAEAQRLLTAAGAVGARMVLRTNAERARMSIARALAAMLGEVGLEVVVRPSETATVIADLNAGRFDLALMQVPEVLEPHVLSWFFDSSRIPEGGQVGANRWRLRDAEVDAALERGRAATTRRERVAAYQRVQERLAEILPVVPLWQDAKVAVVRRGSRFRVPRDGRLTPLAR
ncbi:MAG: hypothetical protein CMN30_19810 [Sandaracinus sp.]|nr:hypothetical protein [Sandaracinus sp.]|tara:strand:- start:225 stop:1703 length:1479 start_codon:yes stop_codon:yes gene_type:complete